MTLLSQLLATRAAVFALVLCRLSGFVVASPFPGTQVPTQQRVGLVLVLGWLAFPFAGGAGLELGPALVGPAMLELLCGLAVGFTFRLVIMTGDVVGAMVTQATGLSSASVFNPQSGSTDSALARVFDLFAMALAIGIGAHRVVIAYLLESFRALPVGSTYGIVAPGVFLDLTGEVLGLGVRLALPALGISLLVQLTLGLISRAAPSLQVFSVGFGIMIASGLAVVVSSLGSVGSGLVEHFGTIGSRLEVVFGSMVR